MNHNVIVKWLRVASLLCVVFLVRWGPLGNRASCRGPESWNHEIHTPNHPKTRKYITLSTFRRFSNIFSNFDFLQGVWARAPGRSATKTQKEFEQAAGTMAHSGSKQTPDQGHHNSPFRLCWSCPFRGPEHPQKTQVGQK